MGAALEQPMLFGGSARPANQVAAVRAAIALRPYQSGAIDGVYAARAPGVRALCVAPTGAGKTVIGSRMILDELAAGGKVIFIAHRTELIEQTYGKLLAMGLDERSIGVVMADGVIAHPVTGQRVNCERPHAPVQVASIDTLRRRALPAGVTLIIVDECHRALARSYRDVMDGCPEAFVVGLTATPYRGDGRGLGDVFNHLVVVTTPRRLMEEGYLAEPRVFSHPHRADLSKVKTVAGDYDQEQLAAAVDKKELIGSMVEHWATHLRGVRTVAFSTNVAHSHHIVEMFRAAGVPAEHLDGETHPTERKGILARVDSGETLVVSNCGVLCLDDRTEVLTSVGWVGIDAMTTDHEVANWTPEAVSFERPSEVVRRDRMPGERMVRVVGARANVRVTEGHAMLYRTKRGGEFLKTPARDLAGRRVEVPVAGAAAPREFAADVAPVDPKRRARLLTKTRYNLRTLEGYAPETIEAEAERRVDRKLALRHKPPHELSLDECRLIGFWIGDGSRTALKSGGVEYVISQSEAYPKIIAWLDGVLARLGVDHVRKIVAPPTSGAPTPNASVRWSLPRGTGGGSQQRAGVFAIERYLDKNGSPLLWGLDGARFDALIEGLWLADGDHGAGEKTAAEGFRIHGTNRRLLDTLQAIGAVRGYATAIRTGSNHARNEAHRVNYILRMTKRASLFMSRDRFEVEEGWRAERVWCVRTRTKNIITRRGGKVMVVGNCEGWDQPSVKGCLLARPTKSRALYVQCAGRVLRPWQSMTPVILDHAGNVLEHDLPHADWEITLEGKKKRAKAPSVSVKECPKCFAAVASNAATCFFCGHPFVESDASKGKEPRERDGQLVEVRADALRALKLQTAPLRAELQDWAQRVDERHGLEPGTTNRWRKHTFRKSRSEMTVEELAKVRAWFLSSEPWLDEPPPPRLLFSPPQVEEVATW